MAGSFDQFATLLREFISSAVVDLQLRDDDPCWNMMDVFEPFTVGGKRSFDLDTDTYPAGYEARYKVKVQKSGRIAGGSFAGNTTQMMGKDSHLGMGQAASALYLDPTKTPMAAWITIHLELKRIIGSVTINHQQIMAELASKPIDDVAGDYMEDATSRFRGHVCNVFYGDGTASLAQVNASGGFTITETDGGVVVTIDGGTFGRFEMGDIIVGGSNASPRVQRTGNIEGFMRVVAIDTDDRTIRLQCEPGEGDIALSDNDHLMLAGTYDFAATTTKLGSLVAEGAESLITNATNAIYPGSISPEFPDGLNVDHHTQLKGFVTDTTSSPVNPTMDALTIDLDKILDTGRIPPTALIAERSLWTLHSQLERENNALIQVPMGATFMGAGGVAGPVLTHGEHTFNRFTSIRIRPESILGVAPTTWRRYMPLGDRTIHWVYGNGPLSGVASIFGPVHSGTQLTELADAPFNAALQFGLTDPRSNFRRLGLRNQRST